MSTKYRHTHKYMRQQLKNITVWRCALPDCPHFLGPHLHDLVIGRSSICWNCGEKFVLSEDSIKDDMPKCFSCANPELVQKVNEDPFDSYLKRKYVNPVEDKPVEDKEQSVDTNDKPVDTALRKKLLKEMFG